MRLMKACLAVIFAAVLANCGGGNDPTINREFYTNSALNTTTNSIISGDNTVFKYEFIHPDGDLTEILWFEVPEDNDTFFNFTFDSGLTIPIQYQRICECPADTYSISSGVVDGAIRSESEWRLAISVVIENSEGLFLPVQDEGNYRLQN